MAESESRRVVVITGASSGIGKAAAKALAALGWHVIGHGRDGERTAAAAVEIKAVAAPAAKVDMVRGDLDSLADTARLATEIAGLTDRVHVLLNNAGGVRRERLITAEGNEATFAGNHLGHFLLTQRLLPLLATAATTSGPGAVRVVNVSSSGHLMCQGLDWENLQQIDNWSSAGAYCAAKLCNLLFTRELAKRVADKGIVANAMHPGVVASNFASHGDDALQSHMASRELASSEDAADTLVWLATAPEAGQTTAGYFYERQPAAMAAAAQDDDAAARLWTESELLVAKAGL